MSLFFFRSASQIPCPLPSGGYSFPADVFSAGVVLAQLCFRRTEESVSDDADCGAKPGRFRERAMEMVAQGDVRCTARSIDNNHPYCN